MQLLMMHQISIRWAILLVNVHASGQVSLKGDTLMHVLDVTSTQLRQV